MEKLKLIYKYNLSSQSQIQNVLANVNSILGDATKALNKCVAKLHF